MGNRTPTDPMRGWLLGQTVAAGDNSVIPYACFTTIDGKRCWIAFSSSGPSSSFRSLFCRWQKKRRREEEKTREDKRRREEGEGFEERTERGSATKHTLDVRKVIVEDIGIFGEKEDERRDDVEVGDSVFLLGDCFSFATLFM